MTHRLAYRTTLGHAYQGDSRSLMADLEPGSVDLIVTSPPFALTRKKEYGNEQEEAYLEWFSSFVEPFQRVLSDTGSLVIDIGGAYLPGKPVRSTYHFQLAVELSRHFDLCQEFYWYNPAKLPSPAEWVNVRRVRVKDSLNLVLWFAKDGSRTKADNRRVLKRYSDSMQNLLKNGYQYRVRPSGHDISDNFSRDNGGAIPSNLLGFAQEVGALGEEWGHLDGDIFESLFPNLVALSNTASNDPYQTRCKRAKVKPHPARFPTGLPAFFIEFLTHPGDTVLEPFAGSNTTGAAAEALGRRWISCDLDREGDRQDTYVRASSFRFGRVEWAEGFDHGEITGDYESEASYAEGKRTTEKAKQPTLLATD